MNLLKVADLWHTLMTGILGYDRYAAAGCDVGALVTGQLEAQVRRCAVWHPHRLRSEAHLIQKLTLFNGDRAWDLSGGRPIRPIPDGPPADMERQRRRRRDRLQLLESDRLGWYNHVNLTAHDHGGHFIPWEIADQWVDDLRPTFRGRRYGG